MSAREHGGHKHRDYALTCAEYDSIYDDQGGACGICGEVRTLVIDHDHRHDLRAVRGLLCNPCNVGLRPVDSGHQAPDSRAETYLAGAWHLRHRPNLPPLHRIPGTPNHEAGPVSVGEIAKLIGVTTQRVQQLMQRPGFPEPWVVLRMGPLWRDTDIEAWAKTRNTQRGRPRKT